MPPVRWKTSCSTAFLLRLSARRQWAISQFYSVIVTRDDEMKRRLAPAHFCQPMVTEAPVVLTFCADTRRTTKWAECRDANPGFSNFPLLHERSHGRSALLPDVLQSG